MVTRKIIFWPWQLPNKLRDNLAAIGFGDTAVQEMEQDTKTYNQILETPVYFYSNGTKVIRLSHNKPFQSFGTLNKDGKVTSWISKK